MTRAASRAFCRAGFAATAITCLIASTSVAAVRTFVSASGNDTNPCTRTSPCRNFAAALAQTDLKGEIVVLESAGYGPVTINKAVSIISPSGIHAAIAPTAGNAITVAAGLSDTVVLRGLFLNGLGAERGIDFTTGLRLFVQDCSIQGFTNAALNGGPDNSDLHVSDTVARNNGFGFIYGAFAPIRGTFVRVRAEYSGYGFAPSLNAIATITDSVATGNTYGFYSGASGSSVLNVERSVSTFNSYGVYSFGISRVKDSLITENTTGLSGTNISLGGNSVTGNGANGSFTSTIPQQ
jgi:hypothetical protein